MTRLRVVLVTLFCWTLGVLSLSLGSIALSRLERPGIIRTVCYFLLLGLVVTFSGARPGGCARATSRRVAPAIEGLVGDIAAAIVPEA